MINVMEVILVMVAAGLAVAACGASNCDCPEAPLPPPGDPSAQTDTAAPRPANKGGALAFADSPIALPAPIEEGGMPLYEALSKRSSTREFVADEVQLDLLSQILWTAAGVNREGGKRTIATARDKRDLTVYAVTAAGVFRYDADHHTLSPVHGRDVRAAAGKQEFAAQAALNLVFVSDFSVIAGGDESAARTFAGAHAGAAAQNVYLLCASEGLGAVVRAHFDADELSKALELTADQHPILAQTVGLR